MSKTSDIAETFAAVRARSRERRALNRAKSTALLSRAGISFVSKNGGAHLIVEGRWDAWVGTGLWQDRITKTRGRGVRELLRHINQQLKRDQ